MGNRKITVEGSTMAMLASALRIDELSSESENNAVYEAGNSMFSESNSGEEGNRFVYCTYRRIRNKTENKKKRDTSDSRASNVTMRGTKFDRKK